MKRLIPFFIIVLSTSLPSQVDTTFSELRGIDDSPGVTHLFYRKYSYQDLGTSYFKRHNDIYHLNIATQSDTLIFEDYFYYTSFELGGPTTNDFELWNNDPAKYISCGAYSEVDPVALIWRYDVGAVWQWLGEVVAIEISKQNDSLLYAYQDALLMSTDRGYTWDYDSSAAQYFNLIVLSPFNDQIFFSSKDSHLYKSTDSGVTYVLVDSSINWGAFANSNLFFDSDGLHIYGTMQGYNQSYFLSSSDAGNTWSFLNSSSNKMYLSVDYSQSGTVYLSDGSEIKVSMDYGGTFASYWQLTRPVVGLYKKPNSDILYAATTKDIYETTPTDTVSIKHLSTIPLSIDDGDKSVLQKFELYQNYPNPFNPTTNLGYRIAHFGFVTLQVYDVAGRLVRTLVSQTKAPGSFSVEWDGRNDQGQPVASGVYLYRLEIIPTSKAGVRNVLTRKMVLIR